MKPVAPTFALAIIVAISLQGASAASCKKITESSSKFASFLRDTLDLDTRDLDDLLTAFKPIHDAAPWLSKCVAAIDPMTIYTTAEASSAYQTCADKANSFQFPETFEEKWVRKSLCPFYGDTVMPCINNVGVQIVLDAMAGTGTCCDDMKTKIKEWFGTDIKTMIADILNKVGSAACSVKTFKDSAGATQSEACLWSMYKSFMSYDTEDYWLSMIQMPTSEVCKAVKGESFKTTQRKAVRFDWAGLNVENFGICYEPLSDVIKMIGAYPIVSTPMGDGVSMADAFASGDDCMLVDSALQWGLDQDSTAQRWAAAFDALGPALDLDVTAASYVGLTYDNRTLASLLDEGLWNLRDEKDVSLVCAHLATGQKCDYNGATVALAFQPATVAPNTTNTTTTTGSAGSLLLGVAFTITSVVSLTSV